MKKKLLIGLVIILAGGLFSYSLIEAGPDPEHGKKVVPIESLLSDSLKHNSEEADIEHQNTNNDVSFQNVNLTDSFMKVVARGIMENSSASGGKIEMPDDPSEMEVELTEEQREFLEKGGIKIDETKRQDITVGDDDSLKAQMEYMENISQITKKSFEGLDGNIIDVIAELMNGQTSRAITYVNGGSRQVAGLMSVSVPPSLIDLHLRGVDSWKERVATIEAMITYNEDPLKALVGLNQLESTLQGIVDMQKEYSKKAGEIKQKLNE